jgi:acyl-CoA thioester hydrolase
MPARRRKTYFERAADAPDPVAIEISRRTRFSEVDVMGIVWFGRYPLYFEEASAELGRRCGLSFEDFFLAGLRAPVVECHIDYYKSLYLDEEFTIRGTMVWHEGSRINTEYHLLKLDGGLAASGYTVQLLTDAVSGEVCIISPGLLERCRERWKNGEFRQAK